MRGVSTLSVRIVARLGRGRCWSSTRLIHALRRSGRRMGGERIIGQRRLSPTMISYMKISGQSRDSEPVILRGLTRLLWNVDLLD